MEIIQESITISFLFLNTSLSGIIKMGRITILLGYMLYTVAHFLVVRAAHTSGCFSKVTSCFTDAAASVNVILLGLFFWPFSSFLCLFQVQSCPQYSYSMNTSILFYIPVSVVSQSPKHGWQSPKHGWKLSSVIYLIFWQWNYGAHVYSMKLLSHTKRWNPVIWVNMEEPGNYYFR